MIMVKYQGQVAGFIGASTYGLAPGLADRAAHDIDRRRLDVVCQWALRTRRRTGKDAGRDPLADTAPITTLPRPRG